MRLLQAIGGTEQEAQALLQGGRSDRISVKEFLDLLFEPCARASLVMVPQKSDPKNHDKDQQLEGILRETLPGRRNI